MSEKRRDNKNRILRTGESQEADGRYRFRYTDANGKRKSVYSWRLVATDSLPYGKRDNLPLREQEKIINRDLEDDILPEPQILLFPLILDNRNPTEEWEINAKQKGPVAYGNIRDIWKYKRQKVHAILSCTQKQKLIEYDKLIEWEKNKYMQTRHEGIKQSWLFHAGKRLEFLADCKCQIVSDILRKLSHQRTITFCKTIAQTEKLGKNCIHSQNKDAAKIYESFNQKKINHITAVNILNENANLVDCKYAIFTNMSSSEVVSVQRIGRSLRHKSPVIILPYYKDTREQEIVNKMIEGFSKESIKTINSIQEI